LSVSLSRATNSGASQAGKPDLRQIAGLRAAGYPGDTRHSIHDADFRSASHVA